MATNNSNNPKNNNSKAEFATDWSKNAENAAKKAEAEMDKIKKEAREQLNSAKVSYNNPDDAENN